MEAAIFQGSYTDLRFVKSRSVAQVIVELPIERAADFVAAFGAPLPGAEIPVALARIAPAKSASEPRNAPDRASEPKERRPFKSLPLAQQAAIRCQDEDFRRFIVERQGGSDMVVTDAESTAATVREICGVASRSEIREQNVSGEVWRDLDRAFLEWKHAVNYESAAR